VKEPNGPFEEAALTVPVPKAGQVLVRIHASGINPLDLKIRAAAAPHARQPLPATLGLDLAGVIEAVGEGVEDFRAGDEVYGMAGGVAGLQGSLAEFMCVDADLLAPKPSNLSMREAAALPLSIVTAWEGLVDAAWTREGQRVLVQGGAGGVGHVVVQIAKSLGGEVYATASAKHADMIRSFGATPIDYKAETVAQYVARLTAGEGFDVVYDTAGGASLDASFSAVRKHGVVVSCLGWGSHSLAPLSFRAASYSGVFTLLPMLSGKERARHGQILREARILIEADKLKPMMHPEEFRIDQVAAAYATLGDAKNRGKVVVSIV
jgi:NADPH:quinone reductase-like Zn-dependent oxidoreductase